MVVVVLEEAGVEAEDVGVVVVVVVEGVEDMGVIVVVDAVEDMGEIIITLIRMQENRVTGVQD